MMAPNIDMPIVKPMALATLKTLERKRPSGRIGSAARVSHQTKSADQDDARHAERDDRRANSTRTRCRPTS